MKIGDVVRPDHIKPGLPPIVVQVQPTGYVEITKPDELKQFEAHVQEIYGIKFDHAELKARAGVTALCETCSCCSDDCGYMR